MSVVEKDGLAVGFKAGRLLLTIDEAADRLGIGRTLMYALVTGGEVESVQIGRLRRVPVEALSDFVARLRRELLPIAE